MVMQDIDIEFSIVSGSNEEMLFGCLESLTKTMRGSRYAWSLTVTCNAPGTGLGGRLRARYPNVAVLDNDSPRSSAANHNRALRLSRARYLWLVSDNLLILPDAVRVMTEFLDRSENARIGVASPRLLNPDGTDQPSTYAFPTVSKILVAHSGLENVPIMKSALSRLAPGLRSRQPSGFQAQAETIDVDTLRGVCVAIRMKAARQVGPINDALLVGGEEAEWHRRFHEQGWKVVYFPAASVIHYGGHAARDGSQALDADHLRGELHFLQTTRGTALYSMFCASLLVMLGARVGYEWARRDRSAMEGAKRYTRVAWDALLRK